MQYVSIPATPTLAEFIEQFWYSSDAPAHQKVRVVPSGTIELVFNLDEDELGFHDTEQTGSCKSSSGAIFSGTHARPLFVDTRAHVMGVHFKPAARFASWAFPQVNSPILMWIWKRFGEELRTICANNSARQRIPPSASAFWKKPSSLD